MKKQLIKALGVVLSAAMICGSVPASVSPAFAAEVSAETTATSEVSVIDIGNEEKESDNSSMDPDQDTVSDNAAGDETDEAAGDDETEEAYWDNDLDIFDLDYKTASADTINEYLRNVPDATIAAWISGLTDADKAALMEKGTDLNATLDYYGEDVDAIGLTDGQHFDTGMEYYELLASDKNVKAYYWASTSGSVQFNWYGGTDPGTSYLKVNGIDTSLKLGSRQSKLSYSVANAKNGLRISANSAYTWIFENTQAEVNSTIDKINAGKGVKYIHSFIGISFDKPVGYAVSAPNYSNVIASTRYSLYKSWTDGFGKGVALVGDTLGADNNYGAASTISARLIAHLSNFGINELNGSKVDIAGKTENINFTFSPATYTATFNGVGAATWTWGAANTLPAAPATPSFSASFSDGGGNLSANRAWGGWYCQANGQVYPVGTSFPNGFVSNVVFDPVWGNAIFTLPAAVSKTGYDFAGWRCDQNGVVYGAGAQHEVNCDVSYTAQWAAHGYTVKFVSDGKDYGEQSFAYGTAQNLKTLADLGISKPGYTFLGWNSTYTDGQSVNNLTDTDDGKVTLTAQWKANTDTPYTVHRYVQKELDKTNPATDYVLYEAPEGTENPILGTEAKTATTDTSVTEIAVAIPGYDTPDAITKTIAGDGSTTYDFYYNITDTRATLTVNHYYQTSIDGDWVLFDGKFGNTTVDGFTNVFNGVIGESMTPEQLSPEAIVQYEIAYPTYTLVPTESPKTVVLTKNSEVNYYYKMVKKNTTVEYKVEHYIQKSEGGAYELFSTTTERAEVGSTVSPAFDQAAIDAVNAVEGCKCEKPQLQVVTITGEGLVFKYNYACVKGTPDVISGGSNLSDETINEIAKKLAAGLSFSMDIDGVTYEIVQNPDGTLAIKFATTTDTKVVIPDVIKIGDKIYRITEVYEKAFKDNTTLKEVVISQNVSKIGNSAFEGCTNLEKVTLKEGLITIGDKAFKDCSSLTSITMPATLQKIGAYAFENCTKLKTVKLNEGLLTIGKKAFYNCKALKQVKIPKSVLKIGSYAFAKCAALTSFTFAADSQLMAMGAGVLSNDKKLTKIKLPGKLTAVPSKAFKNDTKLASITIGKSVTKIGAEAFNGCKAVKKVTIPAKVQSIGSKAFYGCKSLKNVSVKSKALTSVGEKAFKKCKKGLRIVVPGNKTTAYKKLLNGKY